MSKLQLAVRQWLQDWQRLIAKGDFDAARGLFDRAVLGYGTVTVRAEGLDALVNDQWTRVWTCTSDFEFDLASIDVWEDGSLIAAGLQWISTARNETSGELFQRKGRATILWRWQGQRLLAVHTHFSINPVLEPFLPKT